MSDNEEVGKSDDDSGRLACYLESDPIAQFSDQTHQSLMRALTLQFSVLIGILTFVSQMTNGTGLEPSIYRGLATAAAIFLVMLIGDLAIQAVTRPRDSSLRPRRPSNLRKHDSGDRPDALAA